MYVSAWQNSSRSSYPSLYIPPLTTSSSAVPDAELAKPNSPSAHSSQGGSPGRPRLPSVNMILENINNSMTQGNVQELVERPRFGHPSFAPKFAYRPVQGHSYRTSHARSLSLSNFQFASTFSNRNRSFSFSYTPVRFMPPKDPVQAPGHQGMLHHPQVSPRGSIGKKRGRKKKADVKCGQCLLENTPEWRRGPNGSRTLCNACGLYYLKLTKKFGYEDANVIFAYKKQHNQVLDRIVPTTMQRDRFVLEHSLQKNHES